MRAMPEWTLYPHQEGFSALDFLRCRLPAAPTAYLRRLLLRGKVLRGTACVQEHDLLASGDCLRLPDSARIKEFLEASAALGVEILWETPHFLIVNKPPGLAVHRGQGHEEDNLLLRVERLLTQRGEKVRPAPIHRLDRDTSGALLLGKDRNAAGELGKLFMAGAAAKIYLALVCGPGQGSGLLTAPVAAKGKIKDAVTAYRFLTCTSDFSLVELRLETGRTHQIRRHLAACGHPLMGDQRYGGQGIRGQRHFFLHCRQLSFINPWDGHPRSINAPLPENFVSALARLQLCAGERA
ncbi:23S rRNA pseudouridine955/2504/2580 synthase [Geoalkalibacter ferrihydriticus]|uniref:Pseudouridine synthase RsuA/RluA-like domain-containing protein n=3 Tax=Geoalkalibacter ferrihydriticus TaxID=392333 RepID=A0A0C2HJ24_9BACT|nr:hypothetical protein GFER_08425 [Geoalkalibacter ferrihydriticus DSM 17813]SDL37027.1 23S rRNA pseudouridine955/2504/2580 synthase [Geoalkalibacter ferrihydriticus]